MLAGQPFSKRLSPIRPKRSSSSRSSSTEDSDEAETSTSSLSQEEHRDINQHQEKPHREQKNEFTYLWDHSVFSGGHQNIANEDESGPYNSYTFPRFPSQLESIQKKAERQFDLKKLENFLDPKTDILQALTISRDQTEASNFKEERLIAISGSICEKKSEKNTEEDVEKNIDSLSLSPTLSFNPFHPDPPLDPNLPPSPIPRYYFDSYDPDPPLDPGPPFYTGPFVHATEIDEPRISREKDQQRIEVMDKPLNYEYKIAEANMAFGEASDNIQNPWLDTLPEVETSISMRSNTPLASPSADLGNLSGNHHHSYPDTRQSQTAPILSLSQPDSLENKYAKKDHIRLIGQLLERVKFLERNIGNSNIQLAGETKKPRFQMLHTLGNDNNIVCLEKPTWNLNKQSGLKLKAELPLVDLDSYLRRNEDISFLVFRSYNEPGTDKSDWSEILGASVMPSPKHSAEYIHVISEDLRLALETFIRSILSEEQAKAYVPFQKICAPYIFWYDYRSNRQISSTLNTTHQMELKLLVDWIEANYASEYDFFNQMISRKMISYNFIDYLFNDGNIVVSRDQGKTGKTQAYRLQGVPALTKSLGRMHHPQNFEKSTRKKPRKAQSSQSDDPWAWDVSCWSIGYDGQFFRQETILKLRLRADTPDDEVPLDELNLIPIQYVEKPLTQQLLQRGTTFWSCRVKKLISYRGGEEGTLDTNGERYMIDNESYNRLHVEAQKSKRKQDYPHVLQNSEKKMIMYVKEMKNEEPPTAPEIYLFPPMIRGFSLRRKRWIDLAVDNITEVSWNKNAFKHLVANEKTKELIQALMVDRISSNQNTDLIQGKGNGLIILLHGGPGTGKTFTAESVAEMAEKPLYPVSCGDIGTEPEQVEKYLESVLYLGNIWDCVVLLDEADVFLEERGIADLARNALVSVFLRVLEYYDGILILTSNRVGTFDEAFKSRISLSLHYPNFNEEQRCRIWKNFLNRLRDIKEQNVDFDDINDNMEELVKEELNGRQIRNAITIGRQLAKFRGENLNHKHLGHVVEVAGQFEKYVKETKENLSHDQIARLGGIR